MLVKDDKLVVTKKVAEFLDVGDVAKVIEEKESGISFAFGDDFMHLGFMSHSEFEEHFEKMSEKVAAPSITPEHIHKILESSEFEIATVFDKCTVVSCRLPNGFVIVEYSACVSPENYDEETGFGICLNKITDKLWELEAYNLQEKLYRENLWDCDNCECHYCDPSSCDHTCIEERDECLDTDLDCDDCDELDCPHNPNR